MVDLSEDTAREIDRTEEMNNLKKLEAVLFISGRFLGIKDLIAYTDMNPILIRELMDKLIEKYYREDSALQILKKDDLWKMDVKGEYIYLVNKIATGNTEFTSAEQETLAIIAYKQPIKQSVLINIRGNKAYDHIKKLLDLGLLTAKKEGRTYMLNLTDEFYDYFNIDKRKIQTAEVDESLKEAIARAEKEEEEKEKLGVVEEVNVVEEKNSDEEN